MHDDVVDPFIVWVDEASKLNPLELRILKGRQLGKSRAFGFAHTPTGRAVFDRWYHSYELNESAIQKAFQELTLQNTVLKSLNPANLSDPLFEKMDQMNNMQKAQKALLKAMFDPNAYAARLPNYTNQHKHGPHKGKDWE